MLRIPTNLSPTDLTIYGRILHGVAGNPPRVSLDGGVAGDPSRIGVRAESDFDESEHPRDDSGKFTESGGVADRPEAGGSGVVSSPWFGSTPQEPVPVYRIGPKPTSEFPGGKLYLSAGRWRMPAESEPKTTAGHRALAQLRKRGVTPDNVVKNLGDIMKRGLADRTITARGKGWYRREHNRQGDFARVMEKYRASQGGRSHGEYPPPGEITQEMIAGVTAVLSSNNVWDRLRKDGKYTEPNWQTAKEIVQLVIEDKPIAFDSAWRKTRLEQSAGRTDIAKFKYGGKSLVGQTLRPSDMSPELLAKVVPGITYRPPSATSVANAFRIVRGESFDSVLGTALKVRSFRNNFVRPDSPDSVTNDVFMVRAATGKHFLGVKGEEEASLYTTKFVYSLMDQAIRHVAEEHGLLPHEAQAIIWSQYKKEHDVMVAARRRGEEYKMAAGADDSDPVLSPEEIDEWYDQQEPFIELERQDVQRMVGGQPRAIANRLGEVAVGSDRNFLPSNTARSRMELERDARDAAPDFRTFANDIAKRFGAATNFGADGSAVKPHATVQRQVIDYRGREDARFVQRLPDVVRGTIVTTTVDQMRDVIAAVRSEAGSRVRIINKFAEPNTYGYAAVHLYMLRSLPDGRKIKAELRVVPKPIFDAADKAHSILFDQSIPKGERLARTRALFVEALKKVDLSAESYFSDCPRSEQGWCLPSGESEAPTEQQAPKRRREQDRAPRPLIGDEAKPVGDYDRLVSKGERFGGRQIGKIKSDHPGMPDVVDIPVFKYDDPPLYRGEFTAYIRPGGETYIADVPMAHGRLRELIGGTDGWQPGMMKAFRWPGAQGAQTTLGVDVFWESQDSRDQASTFLRHAFRPGDEIWVGGTTVKTLEQADEHLRTAQRAPTGQAAPRAAISQKDTIEIAKELETSRNRMANLIERRPDLSKASQDRLAAHFGSDTIPVFRVVSLYDERNPKLREESGVVSTSIDPAVAMKIGHEAPAVNFSAPNTIVLRYDVPKERIVAYAPELIRRVRESQPKETLDKLRITTRHYERMPVSEIFDDTEREQEVLVDVSGLKPKVWDMGGGGIANQVVKSYVRDRLLGDPHMKTGKDALEWEKSWSTSFYSDEDAQAGRYQEAFDKADEFFQGAKPDRPERKESVNSPTGQSAPWIMPSGESDEAPTEQQAPRKQNWDEEGNWIGKKPKSFNVAWMPQLLDYSEVDSKGKVVYRETAFDRQSKQYPKKGPDGIGYFKGELSKTEYVDTLLYREKGKLIGILNHFPKDMYSEKKGNITVLVDESARRKGVGAALIREAGKRWNVDLTKQTYSPEGAHLAAHLMGIKFSGIDEKRLRGIDAKADRMIDVLNSTILFPELEGALEAESYFSDCPRNEQGWCLPSGESGREAPTSQRAPKTDAEGKPLDEHVAKLAGVFDSVGLEVMVYSQQVDDGIAIDLESNAAHVKISDYPTRLSIDYITVSPDQRGKGVAAKLIAGVAGYARAVGKDEISFSAVSDPHDGYVGALAWAKDGVTFRSGRRGEEAIRLKDQYLGFAGLPREDHGIRFTVQEQLLYRDTIAKWKQDWNAVTPKDFLSLPYGKEFLLGKYGAVDYDAVVPLDIIEAKAEQRIAAAAERRMIDVLNSSLLFPELEGELEAESYFSDCPRNEQGWCLPSGESEAPTSQHQKDVNGNTLDERTIKLSKAFDAVTGKKGKVNQFSYSIAEEFKYGPGFSLTLENDVAHIEVTLRPPPRAFPDESPKFEVKYIAIADDQRGKGIAPKLIASVAAYARSLGKDEIVFTAASDSGSGMIGGYAWAKPGVTFKIGEASRLAEQYSKLINRPPQLVKLKLTNDEHSAYRATREKWEKDWGAVKPTDFLSLPHGKEFLLGKYGMASYDAVVPVSLFEERARPRISAESDRRMIDVLNSTLLFPEFDEIEAESESYFSDCPRNEQGWCLPSGASDREAPTGQARSLRYDELDEHVRKLMDNFPGGLEHNEISVDAGTGNIEIENSTAHLELATIGGQFEIALLNVNEDERRSGIASRLITQVAEYARSQGHDKIHFTAVSDQTGYTKFIGALAWAQPGVEFAPGEAERLVKYYGMHADYFDQRLTADELKSYDALVAEWRKDWSVVKPVDFLRLPQAKEFLRGKNGRVGFKASVPISLLEEKAKQAEASKLKVYKTRDDVEELKSWGETYWRWKGDGDNLRGKPIDHIDLPLTLYHATTNLSALRSADALRAQMGSAGLGGGTRPGVSLTTSRSDAELIVRELKRAHFFVTDSPENGVTVERNLTRLARDDEKLGGLSEGALEDAVRESMRAYRVNAGNDYEGIKPLKERAPGLARDAFNAYLQRRAGAAEKASGKSYKEFTQSDSPMRNPLLFSSVESLQSLNPGDVGIVAIPKASVPTRALLEPGDDYLHEVRVHADVPLRGVDFGEESPKTKTDTPEFKSWFGGSKAVSQEGKPLVAYHSTTKEFDKFDTEIAYRRDTAPDAKKVRQNPNYAGALGTWFTAPAKSGSYDGDTPEESAADISNEYVRRYDPKEGYVGEKDLRSWKEGASIVPVYLSIKNPFEVYDFFELSEEAHETSDAYAPAWAEFRERLIEEGYDGVVVRDSTSDDAGNRDDWVAFYPEQIKSVFNKGSFDPKDPRISAEADFDESEHPRADDGKFTESGGGEQAAPSESSSVTIRGLPIQKVEIDGKEYLQLYHGTSGEREASIIRSGVLSAQDAFDAGFSTTFPEYTSKDKVYVVSEQGRATGWAAAAATLRAGSSTKPPTPVVLRLHVPIEELAKFRIDKNFAAANLRKIARELETTGKLKAEWVDSVIRGTWGDKPTGYNNTWAPQDVAWSDWQKVLRAGGDCLVLYVALPPEEAFEAASDFDESEHPRDDSGKFTEGGGAGDAPDSSGGDLYHVTYTKNVPSIQEKGLLPMQTTNWVKAGNKQRYGGGQVFAFTNLNDAIRWAGKMDWDFHKGMGTGKISIVRVKRDGTWNVDDADIAQQAGLKGQQLKRMERVSPEHIVGAEVLTNDMLRKMLKAAASRATELIAESYFSDCPRNEQGWCLPSGESEQAPTEQHAPRKEFAPTELGKKWSASAKEKFGTTDDFHKSAFITRDGDMLNFKWHADISKALPVEEREKYRAKPVATSFVSLFMGENGAVRIADVTGEGSKYGRTRTGNAPTVVYIEVQHPPSEKQIEALRKAPTDTFMVDVALPPSRMVEQGGFIKVERQHLSRLPEIVARALAGKPPLDLPRKGGRYAEFLSAAEPVGMLDVLNSTLLFPELEEKIAAESYFTDCPRDEHGWCLPSGESREAPTDQRAPTLVVKSGELDEKDRKLAEVFNQLGESDVRVNKNLDRDAGGFVLDMKNDVADFSVSMKDKSFYADYIRVADDQRGKGIAARVIASIAEYARSLGADKINFFAVSMGNTTVGALAWAKPGVTFAFGNASRLATQYSKATEPPGAKANFRFIDLTPDEKKQADATLAKWGDDWSAVTPADFLSLPHGSDFLHGRYGSVSYDAVVPLSIIEDRAKAAMRVAAAAEPTPGQARAGNYQKDAVRFCGLAISIENPKGSIRKSKEIGLDGKPTWEQELRHAYGYIKGTKGADGDHVDCFLSDDALDGNGWDCEAMSVFVVNQVDKDTGEWDEHKVLLGFPDVDDARDAYLANYDDKGKENRIGSIREFTLAEFKDWLFDGDTKLAATSYFEECPRNEQGWCLPSGESKQEAPTESRWTHSTTVKKSASPDVPRTTMAAWLAPDGSTSYVPGGAGYGSHDTMAGLLGEDEASLLKKGYVRAFVSAPDAPSPSNSGSSDSGRVIGAQMAWTPSARANMATFLSSVFRPGVHDSILIEGGTDGRPQWQKGTRYLQEALEFLKLDEVPKKLHFTEEQLNAESYFEECPRNEQGWCLPSGESGREAPTSLESPRAQKPRGTPFASPAFDNIRSKPLFHATPDTKSAMEILRSGVIESGHGDKYTSPRAFLAPVPGAVYLTQQKNYAAIYALGGVVMGHDFETLPKGFHEGDKYGYVFEVDNSKLGNVLPDEDSIGESVARAFPGYGLNSDMTPIPVDKDLAWLADLAQKNLTERQLMYVRGGEYIHFAQAGKKLGKLLSASQVAQLLNKGAHIAHFGAAPIVRAWRVDKTKTKDIAPNGSNLFDVSELIFDKEKGINKLQAAAESYFSDCPRNEQGWCLPSGESSEVPISQHAPESGRVFYHGTTERAARAILTQGLKPGRPRPESKTKKGHVYVASDLKIAQTFANLGSRHPMVLKLRVPKAVYENFLKDEHLFLSGGRLKSQGYAHKGAIGPEHIVGVSRSLIGPGWTRGKPAWSEFEPVRKDVRSAAEEEFVTLYAPYLGDEADIDEFLSDDIDAESYFSDCPRNEQGWCLPSGEADAPTQQEAPKGRMPKWADAATDDGPTDAFAGYEPGGRFSKIQSVPIKQVTPTEENLDESKVASLMDAMRNDPAGVPPIMTTFGYSPTDAVDMLDVADGHHRLEAAKRLGLIHVPVRVFVPPDDLAKVKQAGGFTVKTGGAPTGQAAPNLPPSGSAVDRFDAEQVGELREVGYKDRSKLVEMPIATFLELAEPGYSPLKEADVREVVKSGKVFNSLPYLTIAHDEATGEAKVRGHEGRHRARMLLELGYKTMPVVLRSDVIRWSSQDDPKHFDYVKKWPTVLKSEDGKHSIGFPVAREDAAKPYTEKPDGPPTGQAAPERADDDEPRAPDTPEFKAWFKDSKVVDEEGKPYVVYHGTDKPFDVFDPVRHGDSSRAGNTAMGFFFTDYFPKAELWSGHRGVVMDVYLSLQKPLRLKDTTGYDNDIGYELRVAAKDYLEHDPETDEDWLEYKGYLERQGYDGIDFSGPSENVFVAFHPTQIKSINNKGTFNPKDPRISAAGDFEEEEHPRDDSGKFTDKGGAGESGGAGREGPLTVHWAHNTEKAGNFGSQFGQDVEPAGRYLVDTESRDQIELFKRTLPKGWERGTITFEKPLRIAFGGTYEDKTNWKHVLSERYDGKTGVELSKAIVADGYDGIVTHDSYGTSEIVDLTHFARSAPEPFDFSGRPDNDLRDAESGDHVRAILDHYKATKVKIGGVERDNLYLLDDHVVEWDGGDDAYPSVTEKAEWINDQDPTDFFPDYEERFNKEFWEYPSPLYHATQEENAESIEKEGLGARHESRAISNRFIGAAVFTVSDPNDVVDGSYGDAIFEIDTAAMKRDGLTPRVYEEPALVEEELRGALAHAIGTEYEGESSWEGYLQSTVVVDANIPAKYLRRVDSSELRGQASQRVARARLMAVDSYFSDCPRNEQGWCLPSGESEQKAPTESKHVQNVTPADRHVRSLMISQALATPIAIAHRVERDRYRPDVYRQVVFIGDHDDKAEAAANEAHWNGTGPFKGMSQFAKVDELARRLGVELPSRDDAKKRVEEHAQKLLAKANIAVRVPITNMGTIVSDGRLKTQVETGTSTGDLDPDVRRKVEEKLFHVDPEQKEGRPIYGFLAEDLKGLRYQQHMNSWIDHYGDVSLVLKPEARERSTFTGGDSLAEYDEEFRKRRLESHPEEVQDPEELRFVPRPVTATKDASLGFDLLQSREFMKVNSLDDLLVHHAIVEAQIHGGVSLDDVEKVIIHFDPEKFVKFDEAWANKLIDRGIPIEVYVDAGRDSFRQHDMPEEWREWMKKNAPRVTVTNISEPREVVTPAMVRGLTEYAKSKEVKAESYFSDCPRDEHGWCLPSGEGEQNAPTGQQLGTWPPPMENHLRDEYTVEAKPGADRSSKSYPKLRAEENRIRDLDWEEMAAYDTKGNVLYAKRGDQAQVKFTDAEAEKFKDAAVFTHNHPSGRSFSAEDIWIAMRKNIHEIRATGINDIGESFIYIARPRGDRWVDSSMSNPDVSTREWNKFSAARDKAHEEVRADFQKRLTDPESIFTYGDANRYHHHEQMKRMAASLGFDYTRIFLGKTKPPVRFPERPALAAAMDDEPFDADGSITLDKDLDRPIYGPEDEDVEAESEVNLPRLAARAGTRLAVRMLYA